MVKTCCVRKCRSRAGKQSTVSFFRFPAVRKRFNHASQEIFLKQRLAWYNAVNREKLDISKLDNLRICSRHFIRGYPADYANTSDPDWVPSIEMGYEENDICSGCSSVKLQKPLKPKICEELTEYVSSPADEEYVLEPVVEVSVKNEDISNVIVQETEVTEANVLYLKNEISSLRSQLEKQNEEIALLRSELQDRDKEILLQRSQLKKWSLTEESLDDKESITLHWNC